MGVSARPRPDQVDALQPVSVDAAQVVGHSGGNGVGVEQARDAAEVGVGTTRQPLGRVVGGNQAALDQPVDRPPLGAHVVKGKPGAPKLGEVELEQSLKRRNAPRPLRAPCNSSRA